MLTDALPLISIIHCFLSSHCFVDCQFVPSIVKPVDFEAHGTNVSLPVSLWGDCWSITYYSTSWSKTYNFRTIEVMAAIQDDEAPRQEGAGANLVNRLDWNTLCTFWMQRMWITVMLCFPITQSINMVGITKVINQWDQLINQIYQQPEAAPHDQVEFVIQSDCPSIWTRQHRDIRCIVIRIIALCRRESKNCREHTANEW